MTSDPDRKIPDPILPWKADPDRESLMWAINFVSTRDYYDKSIWHPPEISEIDDQVISLVNYLRGTRRFVICLSTSPTYMRNLYRYVAASWSLTTNTRAEIADIQTLIDASRERNVEREDDSGKWEALEESDLLIIPYAEEGHAGLKYYRGSISTMLMRRRVSNRSTLTDLQISPNETPPTDLTQRRLWIMTRIKTIASLYGQVAFDIFHGENSKHVLVTAHKKNGDLTPPINEERGDKNVGQKGFARKLLRTGRSAAKDC